MQTLLDPFEASPGPLPSVVPPSFPSHVRAATPSSPVSSVAQAAHVANVAPPVRRVSAIEIDLDFEPVEDRPAPRQPGADASGRLRTWCSED